MNYIVCLHQSATWPGIWDLCDAIQSHVSKNDNPFAQRAPTCFKLRFDEKSFHLHLSCAIGPPAGLEQLIAMCPLVKGVRIDGRRDGPFAMVRDEKGQWQKQSSLLSNAFDTPKPDSRFERLPPELRNAIYGYVLTQAEPVILTMPDRLCTETHPERRQNVGLTSLHHSCNKLRIEAGSPHQDLGLTMVSKTTRKEALPIYYSVNKFAVRQSTMHMIFCAPDDLEIFVLLGGWLQALHRADIRRIGALSVDTSSETRLLADDRYQVFSTEWDLLCHGIRAVMMVSPVALGSVTAWFNVRGLSSVLEHPVEAERAASASEHGMRQFKRSCMQAPGAPGSACGWGQIAGSHR
ncbi:hypothetical protein Tdes44962_MAKER02340 [Teratosphaeria destructans]|uniref:DUF7730 domain-containing protein n=1 Tax=Teratosphaeria destructans TaxID=418781 RepID=A0A9W7SU36_9PEZI|nr:hypothetical protein Tdes44962_MAKER02340 [Teratosphaeria destructans]